MNLPPIEPKLALDDIQGIAVPGFFKPHQTLLYVHVPKKTKLVAYQRFLANLEISNGAATLGDRRGVRAARKQRVAKSTKLAAQKTATVLTAIGFTYQGLRTLVPSAWELTSVAFKQGLVRRSSLLGDPADPTNEGHPKRWVVGGPNDSLDAIIVIAGDTRADVSRRATKLLTQLTEIGVVARLEHGDVRADEPGHEHFGFADGISQPGLRGRASDAPNDFVTERHLDASETPAAWLYGYPGQELVWPGEFVFGYPATSPDPLVPGPIVSGGPAWTANGSYLVYRRLRQDVVAFWQTMRDEAARLSARPGFGSLADVRLASLLVGRWPSGAPVARTAKSDLPDLGADALANNDFLLDSDTPALKLAGSAAKKYPQAKADPAGVTCPWAAHIRKVNPRDSASDVGGTTSTQARRILRVGVAFGPSLPAAAKYGASRDPAQGERGLLFLSIQSSIEEQFEFLQARWMNDETRPKTPGGHDMVVGQNAATVDGIRRCALFGEGLTQAHVGAAKQFVIPTGGAYLFVPSLSALRTVIAGG